jgi:transcriptional regulator with XRE-family HTH domain
MSTGTIVDLTTIFGRIVGMLRQELGLSQAAFSEGLKWERSLIARIETGRNMASIDNIFELEERFMEEKLIFEHGDLVTLTARASREAIRRGLRPIYGETAKPDGDSPVEVPTLDRIVARIVDDWLDEVKAERAERAAQAEPADPAKP